MEALLIRFLALSATIRRIAKDNKRESGGKKKKEKERISVPLGLSCWKILSDQIYAI